MIVSLISQKGGVGKSALSCLLAVEFARSGWSVKIADLDPAQGTSTKWKARRDVAGLHPDVSVEKFRTVERALKEADRYDLLVLDGPAHAERGGRIMAQNSDLSILPTGYSIDDMEPQIEVAYDLEEAGIDPDRLLFVFCRARGSESEDKAARNYLRKARMNVLIPVMPEMASIRQGQAEGRVASEIPFRNIQARAVEVTQAIADRMMKEREAV